MVMTSVETIQGYSYPVVLKKPSKRHPSLRILRTLEKEYEMTRFLDPVEGALIAAQKNMLKFDLPQVAAPEQGDFKSFQEMERKYILRVLKAKNWKIGGKNSAASAMKMHVNTLRSRMKKLGIRR